MACCDSLLARLLFDQSTQRREEPIFVLGMLRLNLNWDYDRLQEMVNNHATIRQMLGHGFFDEFNYHLQTIKDNVALFTPEILDNINQIVISAGHKVVKKKIKICERGAIRLL